MKVNKIVVLGWIMMFVGFLIASIPQVFGEIMEIYLRDKNFEIRQPELGNQKK